MPKYFSPEEFERVKLLQKAGLGQKQIAEIIKRTSSPIGYALKAKTFADYQAANRQRYTKKPQPKLGPEEPDRTKPPVDLPLKKPAVRSSDGRIIELLESIDGKLSVMAGHMSGEPKRRFFS